MSQLFSSIPDAFSFWWLVVPLLILFILREWWRVYIVDKYIDGIDWVLLELRVPKENLRTIKAMEQVIATLHGTYSFGLNNYDQWIKGKVEDWISLEIAGFSEGVHFYIRAPRKHQKLVESAIFSQYPDAELVESEDYVNRIKDKPFEHKDIFGTDFILAKPGYLPIRTYESFEDTKEEFYLDPIATITEVMTRLKNNEALWLQLLVRPTGDALVKEGEDKMAELMGNKKKDSGSVLSNVAADLGDVIRNLPTAVLEPPAFGTGAEGGGEKTEVRFRSPGEDSMMKAINNKASKPFFETILRFVYVDDRDEFTGENITSIMGALRQLTDQNLNALMPNLRTLTAPTQVGKVNKKKRLADRKQQIVIHYINREMPRPNYFPFTDNLELKVCVLNTEEIATLFHMPTDFVKSRKIQSIQSKKGEAPIDLPLKER